jgi:hypothetical protein
LNLVFSPDGGLAYSAGGATNDGTDFAVRVWNVETGRQVGTMEGHRRSVSFLAISPDGRRVMSGGLEATPILWDTESRTEIRRLRGHTDRISSVAFLPNGRLAASSGWDGTIRLWDIETGDEVHRFEGLTRSDDTWIAVSPDGRRMFTTSWMGRNVRLWDLDGHKQLDRIDWGGAQPVRGSFTPDGRHVLCGGDDGTIRVYELQPDESGTSVDVNAPDASAIVYLCDLQETRSSVWTGALGKNGDLGYDPGNGDRRIIVKGVLAQKGLSMHAPARGFSFARYQLRGKYTSFRSEVAANDSIRVVPEGMADTPMTFFVVGDGRELWKSQPIQRLGESQPCTVDVTGVRQLELRVSCARDGQRAAHAVWVDPYVQ